MFRDSRCKGGYVGMVVGRVKRPRPGFRVWIYGDFLESLMVAIFMEAI